MVDADADAERERLVAADAGIAPWRQWGPYLAERAWGTVREDYSASGDAWSYLPHDAARSTAYRWNEDGLGGLCDLDQTLCLALALWNGVDPILKERAFGLTNSEGNHGEDVKELFWYVDATPTASWLRWRYRYPQTAFPYADLVRENGRRDRGQPEYELVDTEVFNAGWWEVTLDVAKAAPDDLCLLIGVTNAGPTAATLHVLPTLWFRNTWSWGRDDRRPTITLATDGSLVAEHHRLGRLGLRSDGTPRPLFCDNETNVMLRYDATTGPAYPKDAIGAHVVDGAPLDADSGTKAALWHQLHVQPGATAQLRLRLGPETAPRELGDGFSQVLTTRHAEADAFHSALLPAGVDPGSPGAGVARQALAGMVWGKCFYHYDVADWLDGDPGEPAPPAGRGSIRNGGWRHVDAHDVLSMPDAWEYPWFAAWDLAFHTVALAHMDPTFAKDQLVLLCREWYMHPTGQLPAYEWSFSDVNPPVHAWAALEVFAIDGGRDYAFLERVFHKLLINFTWWVNKEDQEGNNVFEGGFLGLDNIGPFDRSRQPPVAGHLEQSDGTAWMAMYCLDLLDIALTLAHHDDTYEDIATKFFEHFVLIASAMNDQGLWDDADGFYYDVLHLPDGSRQPMRVRSVAGLVALAAVRVIPPERLAALPAFARRLTDFLAERPAAGAVACERRTVGGTTGGTAAGEAYLLSVVSPARLDRILTAVLDEAEFLSPYGLRSLSKRHAAAPFVADLGGGVHTEPVRYEPAESATALFGGNSNWRGPVWFPLNHLVLGGLDRYAGFLGPTYDVALPTGSGHRVDLAEVTTELRRRLIALFLPSTDGRVPAAGTTPCPAGLLQFHEYFHGDNGRGLGAAHQTGWTGLVADLVLRR